MTDLNSNHKEGILSNEQIDEMKSQVRKTRFLDDQWTRKKHYIEQGIRHEKVAQKSDIKVMMKSGVTPPRRYLM